MEFHCKPLEMPFPIVVQDGQWGHIPSAGAAAGGRASEQKVDNAKWSPQQRD